VGVRVTCTCGRSFEVSAEHASSRIKCRNCGREFTPGAAEMHVPRGLAGRILLCLGIAGLLSGFFWPANSPEATAAPEFRAVYPPSAQALAKAALPPTTLYDSLEQRVLTCSAVAAAGRALHPETSTDLIRPVTGGRGELTIQNGTETDAVAILRGIGGDDVRRVYVRAHSTAESADIPTGRYQLLFTSGQTWVPEIEDFCESRGYSGFNDPFLFREVRSVDGVRYSTWTVTLQPVAGGDARVHPISPEDFHRGR
jgi:hypothetical protein